jgi:hypothetical protein
VAYIYGPLVPGLYLIIDNSDQWTMRNAPSIDLETRQTPISGLFVVQLSLVSLWQLTTVTNEKWSEAPSIDLESKQMPISGLYVVQLSLMSIWPLTTVTNGP